MLVKIRETDCIGCTKCIPACPVDAILGSANQMHTVITDECIGCELCILPCPVDCIEQVPNVVINKNKELTLKRARARKKRLSGENTLSPDTKNVSGLQNIDQTLARIKALKKTSKT